MLGGGVDLDEFTAWYDQFSTAAQAVGPEELFRLVDSDGSGFIDVPGRCPTQSTCTHVHTLFSSLLDHSSVASFVPVRVKGVT